MKLHSCLYYWTKKHQIQKPFNFHIDTIEEPQTTRTHRYNYITLDTHTIPKITTLHYLRNA